jgi:hypothetical protein
MKEIAQAAVLQQHVVESNAKEKSFQAMHALEAPVDYGSRPFKLRV